MSSGQSPPQATLLTYSCRPPSTPSHPDPGHRQATEPADQKTHHQKTSATSATSLTVTAKSADTTPRCRLSPCTPTNTETRDHSPSCSTTAARRLREHELRRQQHPSDNFNEYDSVPVPPDPQAASPACSHAPLSTPNHPDLAQKRTTATQLQLTVTVNVAEYDASLTSFTVYTNEYGESAVLTVRSARQLPIRRLVERRTPSAAPIRAELHHVYDSVPVPPDARRQRHRRVRMLRCPPQITRNIRNQRHSFVDRHREIRRIRRLVDRRSPCTPTNSGEYENPRLTVRSARQLPPTTP